MALDTHTICIFEMKARKKIPLLLRRWHGIRLTEVRTWLASETGASCHSNHILAKHQLGLCSKSHLSSSEIFFPLGLTGFFSGLLWRTKTVMFFVERRYETSKRNCSRVVANSSAASALSQNESIVGKPWFGYTTQSLSLFFSIPTKVDWKKK